MDIISKVPISETETKDFKLDNVIFDIAPKFVANYKLFGRFNYNIVKHFKHKTDPNDPLNYIYEILGTVANSENHDEYFVLYRSLKDNKTWIRPFDMFMSLVDKEKYPNAEQLFRFDNVSPEEFKYIKNMILSDMER